MIKYHREIVLSIGARDNRVNVNPLLSFEYRGEIGYSMRLMTSSSGRETSKSWEARSLSSSWSSSTSCKDCVCGSNFSLRLFGSQHSYLCSGVRLVVSAVHRKTYPCEGEIKTDHDNIQHSANHVTQLRLRDFHQSERKINSYADS